MCTLFVAHRVWEDTPLLVAANRDEHLDRPASPPKVVRRGNNRVLAPRDLVAGGTWIGVSSAEVFAGITNRSGSPPDPSRKSRGEIVFYALDEARAAAGAERVARLGATDYNAFHVIVADRQTAHLVWSDGVEIRAQTLSPGFHVLTERSLGAGSDRRASQLLSWIRGFESAGEAPHDSALRARLSFHDPTDPFAGTCLHLPPGLPYGTRSSTLIRLTAPRGVLFAHAEGPPCRTPHEALDPEVRELLPA